MAVTVQRQYISKFWLEPKSNYSQDHFQAEFTDEDYFSVEPS